MVKEDIKQSVYIRSEIAKSWMALFFQYSLLLGHGPLAMRPIRFIIYVLNQSSMI